MESFLPKIKSVDYQGISSSSDDDDDDDNNNNENNVMDCDSSSSGSSDDDDEENGIFNSLQKNHDIYLDPDRAQQTSNPDGKVTPKGLVEFLSSFSRFDFDLYAWHRPYVGDAELAWTNHRWRLGLAIVSKEMFRFVSEHLNTAVSFATYRHRAVVDTAQDRRTPPHAGGAAACVAQLPRRHQAGRTQRGVYDQVVCAYRPVDAAAVSVGHPVDTQSKGAGPIPHDPRPRQCQDQHPDRPPIPVIPSISHISLTLNFFLSTAAKPVTKGMERIKSIEITHTLTKITDLLEQMENLRDATKLTICASEDKGLATIKKNISDYNMKSAECGIWEINGIKPTINSVLANGLVYKIFLTKIPNPQFQLDSNTASPVATSTPPPRAIDLSEITFFDRNSPSTPVTLTSQAPKLTFSDLFTSTTSTTSTTTTNNNNVKPMEIDTQKKDIKRKAEEKENEEKEEEEKEVKQEKKKAKPTPKKQSKPTPATSAVETTVVANPIPTIDTPSPVNPQPPTVVSTPTKATETEISSLPQPISPPKPFSLRKKKNSPQKK
ncbi:hypothetical protein DFA_05196 [Cavenderia fasciculata]|uniref:Uncharacterized protein n=1 Tax=Cavenderia fasciculata TaxID=261658 RepID=F4PNL3_CACFS|nr:uncharacterized protein DFA_05196 [Cavenderia fasciculata]EGG23066.1 hypothetical protein DFA_05196 [Cavenderia fasciculata]|eukprot:XP_004360917.1 hypothetical protein DFA_05196 [Cavenderia fasciculata]